MKLFSFFAFNQLSAIQLRSSLVAAERCAAEQWLDDENVACSNGLESGSLCLRFCSNRNERSKVIQCRCYGEDCAWQGSKPDCFKVDQPANLFSTKSSTTITTTTTTTTSTTSTTTTRRTSEIPSTLQYITETTVLLSKEERKAIKKAKKVANRKKARQEAKKINHFSISSSTTAKVFPSSTRPTTTTAAPASAYNYDPEAPIRIPSHLSNPLARQNRMNPALFAPKQAQTTTTTTEQMTTTESATTTTTRTEGMSLYTDRYEKHLVNKEKRIRQRLHDQLLAKKKKFDIQSRSQSKFQQDSVGFEDYEAEEDPIMFLESETLENFIADTDRVLNMTISTELVCPEQTNQMVKCSYDNIEGSICVRKDCKNSSVSSCNCVNGLCSWSVGEPICQTWGSGCLDGVCESCDKVDWQSDENFIW
ncbi:unnamed protein product [Oikopleura dioica]|uniref:Uncharacterized protein n=2 Tax=Oikopleura dioica TaxID=34765 RepID=E4XS93_OIKDI|nr:unnamed protein product [Oikopleura dioica]CBY32436.1 unnamed protein product [Oikopleura dioica]